ncbi:N-acetylmuramoyl-L-alanine amidase [Bacillus thuringiensis]|uniref:Autolysin n=1 Tax=Bacillus thuringiensis serovar andalousiensis TaxID=257985 RepID=A0A6H0TR24_BACTU|nr:N-acetylmuramoyl-L-alanine amidase [Bacillus thuringiensis]QIW22420.1 N-acetylmuramoyl-L-alanine amidase [Bacillus thuringiensis serovar andalousiensis]
MKKTTKILFSVTTASIMLLTSVNSIFADREMIVPGLPKVEYRNGYGTYEGVVAHSTATPEAPAINIRNYEARTWRNAFVHYATDWDENIQIASTKYQAWGAGPAANKRFVHVELSETSDPIKFKKSYERYVKLLAKILRDRNIHPSQGLWTHKDITYKLGGTDHEDPLDYLKSHGVSESQFRADVLKAYNGHSITVEVKPQKPSQDVVGAAGIAYIDGYNVNLRSGPSTNYGVIRQLGKGEAYEVWAKQGDWLNLGGNQWIYHDSSYIRYNSGKDESVIGKRVESKVNSLNYYDRPTWNKTSVAGTVDVGLGFTILDEVFVDGSPQYKVKNSRGNVYYITASSYYVRIK